MRYLVLIGDVVGSRHLSAPARASLQKRLRAELEALNKSRKGLVSPYTLTLGDEFQAVFREPSGIFADAFTLLARTAPQRMRFALAVGEIVTPLNPKQAIGMDGPAFHRARAALERLKAADRLFGVQSADEPEPASTTGATLNILSSWVEAWKPTRLILFASLLRGAGVPELAETAGITSRAVNKNIRAAELDEWRTILQNIERTLTTELTSR
jgi:hypothetical protein